MKKRVPVSQIMTTDLILLNLTDSLEKAEILFKKHKIRHIPVVSGSSIVGIVSYTDLLRISFADVVEESDSDVETVVYNMFSIAQVMAKTPMTVSPSTTVKEVVEILIKQEFHALPVVENNELVGIVTTTDLMKYLLEQY